MNMSMSKFRYIDMFCGIGGFHQAMSALGGECVFACDIDADCRKTYEANYGLRLPAISPKLMLPTSRDTTCYAEDSLAKHFPRQENA